MLASIKVNLDYIITYVFTCNRFLGYAYSKAVYDNAVNKYATEILLRSIAMIPADAVLTISMPTTGPPLNTIIISFC